MKNYYEMLDIPFESDLNQIKKAYRQLAHKYHPDKNKSTSAPARFIEITEAYEVLRDRIKRNKYDILFNKYYKDNQISIFKESETQNQQKEWTDYGTEKAKEYSSMNYDEFIRRIFDEIKIGSSYIPNIIFILFCAAGVVGFIYLLPLTINDNNSSPGMVFFLFVGIIGYGILCYYLYKRMRDDYIEERRRKFNK